MKNSIGILGIGTYLPPDVRTNGWWSEQTRATWREKTGRRLERVKAEFAREDSPGPRLAVDAIAAHGDDPFQGGRERRAMSAGMEASDMETAAAREAIAHAGIEKNEIDLLLSYVICPDYINVPSGCVVHANLGLPQRCQVLNVDAVCNSFLMQLSLAQAMIASGAARYALLTQASAMTRLPASQEPFDSWFGDAATAVVVGPVRDGRGILSASHRVDGTLSGALVCGVPEARWYDGKCTAYSKDHAANMDMIVRITDRAKQVLHDALEGAGLARGDVGFYACHQAFEWLRRVTQEHAGLANAKSVDHFAWTGTVSAANLPLQLAAAVKDGILTDDTNVACFQGGTGMTWSGMVLRWGR